MDFPFGSNYFIRQNNKQNKKKIRPCDILCPCKENTFDISNKCENPENTKWILTEDSNPFYNFYCCQYRAMELLAKNNKDDQMTLYKGERPCLIPFFSCEQIQMKIYKYIYQDGKLINKNQIGYIQAFSQDFQRECKVSQIFQKPLIKIIKNVDLAADQQQNSQIFVITMPEKEKLYDYYRRQCCLPHGTLEYKIYSKVNNNHSEQIGTISNEFQGCYKEYCTRGDLFTMSFNQVDELNAETRTLLMYGCLQLNYQEYEYMINLP